MNPYKFRLSPAAAAVAFSALALLATPALADVSFFDGTFNDADWTAAKFIDTTAGASATFTAAQVATGGNPGSYRNTDMNFTLGAIGVAHLSNSSTYDPTTQGAVSTIDFSYDLLVTNPHVPNAAVRYDILLVQGGVRYATTFFGDLITAPPGWTHFSHPSLTASDFIDYASGGFGTANPNFSAAGGLIEFGYVTRNSSTGATVTTHSGIDNWNLAVHTVPEPSTAASLAFGAASLLALRRRRGSKGDLLN